MFCRNCGHEVNGKFCSNCGSPVEILNREESENIVFEEEGEKTAENKKLNLPFITNKEGFYADKKIGPVKIDSRNKMFQVNGRIIQNGKKGNTLLKGVLAVSTMGASVVAGKLIGTDGKKVGGNNWYSFDDLISYELLEDDFSVTKGGLGMALIGGAVFGGVGAITGGIIGKRTTKRKIENLSIRVSINSFDAPLLLIPLIDKPIKTNSKEYAIACKEAYDILAAFDVITHNK